MANDVLKDNLAALARASVESAMAQVAEAPEARVRAAPDGGLLLVTPDGRAVRMASARDPLGDARRLLMQTIGTEPAGTVVVLGAGTGAILEALETLQGVRVADESMDRRRAHGRSAARLPA